MPFDDLAMPVTCPVRRRAWITAAPQLLIGSSVLTGCAQAQDPEGYESLAVRIRQGNAAADTAVGNGDYDGKPLSSTERSLLESAGSLNGVRVLLLTDRQAIERVLAYVVEGNTAQIADPAFVAELKTWIRFNAADAVRTRDGLFSLASGNPTVPAWLGNRAFGWVFTAKGENDKIVRQVRSSAGLAVFVADVADNAHWVTVGRAYERFALQATALGICNAFLNQPVEVAAVRSPLAAALGLAGQRPDLVVRFGRGPTLPSSLRRPVEAVMA